LRNVGGASAGAIAAVGAAACEYRRREDPAAFDRLRDVSREITGEGFVRGLFQPKKETRLALDIGLQLVSSPERYSRRLVRAVGSVVWRRPRNLVLGGIAVVVWAGAVAAAALALADVGPPALGIVGLVVLAVLALAGVGLLVVGLALRSFAVDLNRGLLEGGLGLCRGKTEDGYPVGSGLTDWLHATIQACAGRGPDDPPLTFRDLQGPDPEDPRVSLRLVTTDLSSSRPVVLPLPPPDPDEPPYLFEEAEFERLFPAGVVRHLVAGSTARGQTSDGKPLYELPGLDLPVVVAARLSLSFPVLLETVPLWRKDGPKGEPVCHTMSDGGISSNFPIHFFDALLPSRPTFGLDLQPLRASAKRVEMSRGPRRPLFDTVFDLATFGTQIVNASRNWRDNMQAELPGYRDRVCQIRLAEDEGGLNLGMKREVVEGLIETGHEAGRLVVSESSAEWWDVHRLTRYRMLMQMLQGTLGRKGVGRDCVYRVAQGKDCRGRVPFRERLAACANGAATLPDVDAAWCRRALPASDVVLGVAALLGQGGAIDFEDAALRPAPTMRIVPMA
ncbi:MAG: hypothetical protein ACRDLZ_07570, partial [Gaiellaceae bacterium]